ncbi:Hypothetical protein FKW44_023721, partial [Caligus rogercresseyi]
LARTCPSVSLSVLSVCSMQPKSPKFLDGKLHFFSLHFLGHSLVHNASRASLELR